MLLGSIFYSYYVPIGLALIALGVLCGRHSFRAFTRVSTSEEPGAQIVLGLMLATGALAGVVVGTYYILPVLG